MGAAASSSHNRSRVAAAHDDAPAGEAAAAATLVSTSNADDRPEPAQAAGAILPPSPRPLAEGFDGEAAPMPIPPPASPRSPRPCVGPASFEQDGEEEGARMPLPLPAPPQSPRPPVSPSQVATVSRASGGRKRCKPLPPQMALKDVHDDDRGHTGLRSLTLSIMALTLRGRHRRPATNPTPTTHHEILLSTGSSTEGLSRSEGGGVVVQEPQEGEDGEGGVRSKKGMAATVAGGPPTVRVGGRRPRPLAISGVDAYHYNVSTILPGRLLIGGEDVGGSEATLARLGVKGVVNATKGGREEGAATAWCYVKLGWVDEVTQPILPDLERAFACIEEARKRGGPCLVFCKKGMSRSGAVVVAYLMTTQEMSLWEALTFARNRRAIIAPNVGFMAQLVELEKRTRGKVSLDLEAYENDRFGDTCGVVSAA